MSVSYYRVSIIEGLTLTARWAVDAEVATNSEVASWPHEMNEGASMKLARIFDLAALFFAVGVTVARYSPSYAFQTAPAGNSRGASGRPPRRRAIVALLRRG